MRLLFVKQTLAWPRVSGHDVHCYHLMRALAEAGHAIDLLTVETPREEALHGLTLASCATFAELPADLAPPALGRWEAKFGSYWGVPAERAAQVGWAARRSQCEAVVGVGLEALTYLAGVTGARRVWYAADEWVLHHLSLINWRRPGTWSEARVALVKGLYERAYAGRVDRVWVVSARDARAVRWVMPGPAADLVVNGVDADYFSPRDAAEVPESLVFWGRLDFEPNLDAIRWFAERVWPLARQRFPQASWTVFGAHPTEAVTSLAHHHGFRVVADLPDLRDPVCQHQVVVLPFVSGAGIKNKLLEAAAMGRAIVATPSAFNGVHLDGPAPALVAADPAAWVDHLGALFASADLRRDLGHRARQWVLASHSWASTARSAIDSLEASRTGRASSRAAAR